MNIINQLLGDELYNLVNKDLINYYFTPGNMYNLVKFAELNNYNLSDLDLKSFLKIMIKENHYKKNQFIKFMIFHFLEFYFIKLNSSFSKEVHNKYTYFLRRISDTRTFNLDEETLFIELKEEVLNG